MNYMLLSMPTVLKSAWNNPQDPVCLMTMYLSFLTLKKLDMLFFFFALIIERELKLAVRNRAGHICRLSQIVIPVRLYIISFLTYFDRLRELSKQILSLEQIEKLSHLL